MSSFKGGLLPIFMLEINLVINSLLPGAINGTTGLWVGWIVHEKANGRHIPHALHLTVTYHHILFFFIFFLFIYGRKRYQIASFLHFLLNKSIPFIEWSTSTHTITVTFSAFSNCIPTTLFSPTLNPTIALINKKINAILNNKTMFYR